jgi:thiamine biosynthesis protein ThiS
VITVDGKSLPWHTGMTLEQVIAALEGGGLYVVVRMNDRLISKPDFASTHVPDGSEIHPLPLIAGG